MRALDIIGSRYRLLEKVGQGSFGVIWKAEELLRGKAIAMVAVKVFTVDVNLEEIETLAQLNHPNILGYRSCVEHDGSVCLVTELADGGDASRLLKAYPRGLEAAQVEFIVTAVARALAHLHALSWVHRDVKPGNILFVADTPKLGDVGTAKAVNSQLTRHTGLGTCAYAAPEMFSGQVGPASDAYALAVTAFELQTGRLPFEGTFEQILRGHLMEPVRVPDTIPPRLRTLLSRGLEKDPARRWTVAHMLEHLQARPAVPPTEPARATNPAVPPAPAPQRAAAPPPTPAAARHIPEPPRPAAPDQTKERWVAQKLSTMLMQCGDTWDHPGTWSAFWQSVEREARQHTITEREMVRRASAFREQWKERQAAFEEHRVKVLQWVAAQGQSQWRIQDWMAFLETLPGPVDDDALGKERDELLKRLFPAGTGVTRQLELASGIALALVFVHSNDIPKQGHAVEVLERLASKSVTQVPRARRGVWIMAETLTVAQWCAVTGHALPTDPVERASTIKVARAPVMERFLPALNRILPWEGLRLPTRSETDAIKALTLQGKPAKRGASPKGPVPSSWGGVLAVVAAEAAKQAVQSMANESQEWCIDADPTITEAFGGSRLPFRLVSPLEG